ncbi:MAG TPA: hypothetical protein VJ600_05430 [Holophagaceae bacterium]|nr:hypothetical protein [Holophagaceae bacterium]
MKSAAPFLLAPLLAVSLPAQAASIPGGGVLTLGSESYRFEAESLMASKARPKQMGAVEVRGRLVPKDPAKALKLDLISMGGKYIYRLELVREENGVEKERWAATLKTQVQSTSPENPKSGDKAVFKVSGPLTGAVDGVGRQSSWSGEIWAGFSVQLMK